MTVLEGLGGKQTAASGDPLAGLIAAFERHATSNGDDANEDLRHQLRAFCAYARAEKLAPEEVLIRVKRALDRSPKFRANDPTSSSPARAHIIRLAIEAYFSDRDA